MFEVRPSPDRKRWNAALAASFVLQAALVALLAHRPGPGTLVPSEVALGSPGSSGTVIYYPAPTGPELARNTQAPQFVKVRAVKAPKPEAVKPVERQRETPASTAPDAPIETAHGGSPRGTRIPGTPITGAEVVPALPEVFPDPPVSAAELPHGVQGDVIVEVTIDPQGNVIEEKLLKGIGYGIEEKVLAVLRLWHFRPAMQNGVTVASQHIVHFHYPS